MEPATQKSSAGPPSGPPVTTATASQPTTNDWLKMDVPFKNKDYLVIQKTRVQVRSNF
jgi:hypothetical protein